MLSLFVEEWSNCQAKLRAQSLIAAISDWALSSGKPKVAVSGMADLLPFDPGENLIVAGEFERVDLAFRECRFALLRLTRMIVEPMEYQELILYRSVSLIDLLHKKAVMEDLGAIVHLDMSEHEHGQVRLAETGAYRSKLIAYLVKDLRFDLNLATRMAKSANRVGWIIPSFSLCGIKNTSDSRSLIIDRLLDR